ncbi:MAG: hypothetical protein M1482_11055 [Chloroflexi bacterium]|nr:hypothetical protein [Chloroflexota bacterium]
MPTPRIPVLLCVDAEPDDRSIARDVKSDWRGFEATHELFSRLRTRLESATHSSVRFTWFLKLDPQIADTYGSAAWPVERYGKEIRSLHTAGDHLGLHVHPWRWNVQSRSWVEDFADQEWVDHCLKLGVDTFQRSLSEPCQSVRLGDRWLNDATVALLDRLGVLYDLTIEPGKTGGDLAEAYTGSMPDYTNVPCHPYHPAIADYRQPAAGNARKLWLIPISTGSIHTPAISADRRLASMSWTISRPTAHATGSITAQPNPICVARPGAAGVTNLAWTSEGTKEVQVRVDAPDGSLFSHTGPSGSAQTGEWVAHGTVFYLQDVSDGLPLTETNTLATMRVHVTTDENPAETDEHMTLNLSFNSFIFSRIMDGLVRKQATSHIAIVVRSDAAVRCDQQYNLEQNLEYVIHHPLIERFSFETPPDLVRCLEQGRAK